MFRENGKFMENCFLHVMSRGNSRMIIFEEQKDYNTYLKYLETYSIELNVKINAYCLMSNHVHLLISDPDNQVSTMIQSINGTYAKFFNSKYDRCGHVFQGRPKKKVILDDNNYLSVLRYILNNPETDKICPLERYKWSSFWEYGKKDSFVDTSYAEALLGDFSSYAALIESKNEDKIIDKSAFSSKKTDDDLIDYIHRNLGFSHINDVSKLEKLRRNNYISLIKHNGFSIRQIERVTGISRGVVQKC